MVGMLDLPREILEMILVDEFIPRKMLVLKQGGRWIEGYHYGAQSTPYSDCPGLLQIRLVHPLFKEIMDSSLFRDWHIRLWGFFEVETSDYNRFSKLLEHGQSIALDLPHLNEMYDEERLYRHSMAAALLALT